MEADLQKTPKIKRTNIIPVKDSDLGSLGHSVNVQWKVNPQFTLLWITQAQHEANVNEYNNTLTDRKSSGGGRKEITDKLNMLDKDINLGIAAIKGYLVYKYEKSMAPSYYPQFGIERSGSVFIVPRDRNKRITALPLILAAVNAHGLGSEKYGTAFWQSTMDSYIDLNKQALQVDGSVSSKVGSKNELRKTLVKTHNALIQLLRANYPDTYPAVLREWGFQKEKY